MTINSDPVAAAMPPPAGRLDRHHAEARQGRWMLELERGMLASDAKDERGPEPVRQAAGVPQPMADPDALIEAAQEGASSGETGAPAHQRPETGAGAKQAGRPFTPLTDRRTIAPVLQLAGGTPVAAASIPARAVAAGTQEMSLHLTRVQPVAATLPLAAQTLAELAPAPGEAEPAHTSPPNQQLGPHPEFVKHLLNVYVRQDGVHAFVRDAALTADQTRRLAQTMSAELDAAGEPLAALTVNGQTIFSIRAVAHKGNPQ